MDHYKRTRHRRIPVRDMRSVGLEKGMELLMTKILLTVGLDPAVVDYSKWPGLTREKLEAGSARFEEALRELGYEQTYCLVDGGPDSLQQVVASLEQLRPDRVLIGAGIRLDADLFLLFEQLINAVHEHAPQARILFNSGPDSIDAVRRWV